MWARYTFPPSCNGVAVPAAAVPAAMFCVFPPLRDAFLFLLCVLLLRGFPYRWLAAEAPAPPWFLSNRAQVFIVRLADVVGETGCLLIRGEGKRRSMLG